MNPYSTKETAQIHLFLIYFQAFHQLANLMNPDFLDILSPKGGLKDKSLDSGELLKGGVYLLGRFHKLIKMLVQ